MAKTIGAITGKFAPLHSGHIYAITEASTQVDHLYVILSYDDNWFDTLDKPDYWREHMTKKKRLLWLKRTFQNLDHITILCVDETDMKPYPDGVVEWTSAVTDTLMEQGVSTVDKWFSSEPEYDWWIKEYLPVVKHVILDAERNTFNISATKVRDNPYKYWEFLPSIVRKEFLLKVVVIGTESCAKSTLTKYLAKMFNTSWVEEYGRTYCENEMCMDESLLSFEDYGLIASNRYYQEKQAESTANKVLFVDTNAFVTQYYCALYENELHDLVEAYIDEEKYDIILHLDSNVAWVDDGLRINSDREITDKFFDQMLDNYQIKNHNGYYFISGDYKQRLDTAIEIVKNKLNQGE